MFHDGSTDPWNCSKRKQHKDHHLYLQSTGHHLTVYPGEYNFIFEPRKVGYLGIEQSILFYNKRTTSFAINIRNYSISQTLKPAGFASHETSGSCDDDDKKEEDDDNEHPDGKVQDRAGLVQGAGSGGVCQRGHLLNCLGEGVVASEICRFQNPCKNSEYETFIIAFILFKKLFKYIIILVVALVALPPTV